MNLDVVKLLILVSLFIATYAFALLPLLLVRAAGASHNAARRRKFEKCISFLSCFAAGVFLGTCLLDLYPEVEEKLIKAVDKYISSDSMYKDYPFGESVMVIGFFMVLTVEQVVLAFKEKHEGNELMDNESHTHDHIEQRPCRTSTRVSYNSIEHAPLLDISMDGDALVARSSSVASARSLNGISDSPSRPSRSSSIDELYNQSIHQDPNSHSPIRSFIMLAALSLHSVFEGLAVGLQDTIAGVLCIFGALILHKCIIAFSIGLNLVQSRLSVKAIITSNAVFCIASPIGIALGILVEVYSDKSASDLVNGILQGLACGTFLYVTFFEVLPHEFNKPSDRILKLIFVIIGFVFVNGVLFLEMTLTCTNHLSHPKNNTHRV